LSLITCVFLPALTFLSLHANWLNHTRIQDRSPQENQKANIFLYNFRRQIH
jgi:hypothetical protein